MGFEFIQKLEQKQVLSQQQIYSLNILAMNGYDLQKFLIEEEMENPFLNVKANREIVTYDGDVNLQHLAVRKTRYETEEEVSSIDNVTEGTGSLQEFLLSQADLMNMDEKRISLLSYIIDLLDDNGYLRFSEEEISRLTGVSSREVSVCIGILKNLEPPGIGAFDLRECLELQLRKKGVYDSVYGEILKEHLEDLAAGKHSKLARCLHLPLTDVQKRVKEIKSLSPKPLNGTGFGGRQNQYLIPDLLFSCENGAWSVSLTGQNQIRIGISREYESLLERYANGEVYEYYQDKKKSVLFLKRCIEKRNRTLLEISRYILSFQMDYFERRGGLKALTEKQIADALSIHPSTVSRAVKGKYVQYPFGAAPLKQFLAPPFAAKSRETADASKGDVESLLRGIIKKENRQKPCSDQELAEQLKEKGICISRRTVAAYRAQLNIGNAQNRKLEYMEWKE